MATKAVGLKITIEGREAVVRAFKELGNPDAAFLRAALVKSAGEVVKAVPPFLPATGVSKPTKGRTHTPRASFTAGMKAGNVRGKGAVLSVTTVLTHPGARSYEFGYAKRGQRARPFIGVLAGGGAVGAARPKIEPLIERAFLDEARHLGLNVSGR